SQQPCVGRAEDITQASFGVVLEVEVAWATTRCRKVGAQRRERGDNRLRAAVESKRAKRPFAHVEALRHVVEHPLRTTCGVLGEQAKGDGSLEQACAFGVDTFGRVAKFAQ